MNETTLGKIIAIIGQVLDIDKIVSLPVNTSYTKKYYRINQISYALFHNSMDRFHMGISRDGVYKDDDLLNIPRSIASYITHATPKKILELGTGHGANSIYLAERSPDTTFYGIDVSDDQLAIAKKKALRVQNYIPQSGDYHDLSRFEDGSMDIVFVVEALCYSTNKEVVLAEVSRVLKDGGLFIIFDGYRHTQRKTLTKTEMIACSLIEKGMALERFEEYDSFIEKARVHFEMYTEGDLSKFVLPTMYRFEKLAKRFFKRPVIAKVIALVLPNEFIYNAVSGYLMPEATKLGLFCYMQTVLMRKAR